MRKNLTDSKDEQNEPELTRRQWRLLHAECDLFAVALHRLTGLTIAAYVDEDFQVEGTVLVHAFVTEDAARTGIDVRGRLPVVKMLEEFERNDPELVVLSVAEVLKLGRGRRRFSQRQPLYRAALAEALIVCERLNLKRVSRRPGHSPRGGIRGTKRKR